MFGLSIQTHKRIFNYDANNYIVYQETIGADYICKWNGMRHGYRRIKTSKVKQLPLWRLYLKKLLM